MSNIINYLNGINPLQFFDPVAHSKFTFLGEVNEIIDNDVHVIDYFNQNKLDEISSLDNYVDYLCLKKILSFADYLMNMSDGEAINKLENLIKISKEHYTKISKGRILKFINHNYKELLENGNDNNFFDETYELCLNYQNGISDAVFMFLINHYSYKLFYDYDKIQKKIEKNTKLFTELFLEENVRLNLESKPQYLLDVIISIEKRNKKELFNSLRSRIDYIINYGEEIYKKIDIENVLILERKVRMFLDFLKSIKDVRTNIFEEYFSKVEEILDERIKEKGHKFSYEIPSLEILKQLKSEQDGFKKIISLTHFKEANGLQAHLNNAPSNSNHIIDMISTNIITSSYYKNTHQQNLFTLLNVGSISIDVMMLDEALFQESLKSYCQLINHICTALEYDNNELIDDFTLLHQMLQNVYWGSDKENNMLQQSLCYGTATFICGYTEKLLRTVYKEYKKTDEYVSIEKATLGQLLSDTNMLFKDILGEYQLKHLRFFLLTDEEQRIGFNYRNNLAHWINIRPGEVNRLLVAKLMYLLTSIINSIVYYTLENSKG